jgi:hypothetical protein
MLTRLGSSVNRIKQFTPGAAHELRAPFSFTRTVAEVALRNPHIDPESWRAFEEIVDEGAKAAVLRAAGWDWQLPRQLPKCTEAIFR